eukprot:gene13413-17987_t
MFTSTQNTLAKISTQGRISKIFRIYAYTTFNISRSKLSAPLRYYHSYPTSDDKPVVSTFNASQSTVAKNIVDKSTDHFILDEKFKMEKSFPGFQTVEGNDGGLKLHQTRSTTLSNGLTVASQQSNGLMSSFCFIVRMGSSYEQQSGSPQETGITHLLELNGFRSTMNRSHLQLISEVENLGGMVQCISTRENVLYCIDVLRNNTEKALEIFSDAILNPIFPESELEETKMITEYQKQELPSVMFSRDLVQRAAYKNGPLSYLHYCPENRRQEITVNDLIKFRSKFLFGSNCVLSCAGIDHDYFIRLAEKYFHNLPNGNIQSGNNIIREKSVYSGGLVTDERVLKEPFVRIAIGFEIGGWHDSKLIAACVLQQLLGGGSSFSAGGPGKGMYTRLYTNVLNRRHWAESIEAFLSIHEEVGLFGIDGSCSPEYVGNLIQEIIYQLTVLAVQPVSDEELNRAKNMLKSTMMMQLESRIVLCEDISRQFLTFGKRESPSEICSKIEKITAKDLMEVALHMIKFPPAIGCVGHDLSGIPSFEDIKKFTHDFRVEILKNSIV